MFKGIFGPSQEEVWRQFAKEIDGSFIHEGIFKSKKVVSQFENWTITLDTFAVSTGKSSTSYTRIRVPYISEGDFSFKIYKRGPFSNMGKIFGMQDLNTGYLEFDEKFVIKGNNKEKVLELFSVDRIRELINTEINMRLETKDEDGLFGTSFLPEVVQLHFQTHGVVKDIERLKNMHILIILILNKLVLMESASDKDPGVVLK